MFPLLAAWFLREPQASSAAKQRARRAPGTVTGDGHRLVLLSPATASGTAPPFPLLLAHNSHMFIGERQRFVIGWKWHFNDAIPRNGIVAKPTLGSGRMSNFSSLAPPKLYKS
uniref:Uncharacterized protein n=1 Tax=Oryza rufipogon TaxID=4529 RepID=A0A0E0MUQ4_ORYRU